MLQDLCVVPAAGGRHTKSVSSMDNQPAAAASTTQEEVVRAGLQNSLLLFIKHSAFVFMINPSKDSLSMQVMNWWWWCALWESIYQKAIPDYVSITSNLCQSDLPGQRSSLGLVEIKLNFHWLAQQFWCYYLVVEVMEIALIILHACLWDIRLYYIIRMSDKTIDRILAPSYNPSSKLLVRSSCTLL